MDISAYATRIETAVREQQLRAEVNTAVNAMQMPRDKFICALEMWLSNLPKTTT